MVNFLILIYNNAIRTETRSLYAHRLWFGQEFLRQRLFNHKAPQQMQGGLSMIESGVKKGSQTYDKIRGHIDATEGQVMGKVNEVNRKLMDQGMDFSKLIA